MGEKSLGSFNVICPSLSRKGIRIRKEKKKDSEQKKITKQKERKKVKKEARSSHGGLVR